MSKIGSDTHQKVLELNRRPEIFGTIAEIGAGQEVANHFFRAGSASGSIAKTMSAYDMTFSDRIYGKTSRYVSKERVKAMLDHEYGLLLERLGTERGDSTRFFTFANTVSTKSGEMTGMSHGWVGLRYQRYPNTPPSDVILHVKLRESTRRAQQQSLGILGVNLIYGVFFNDASPQELLSNLQDELSIEQVEIDFIELHGPAFGGVLSQAEWGLELLRLGLASVIIIEPDGQLRAPIDKLYGRPIVIERGNFLDSKSTYLQILATATAALKKHTDNSTREAIGLPEYSLRQVGNREAPSNETILDRMRPFQEANHSVLISNFPKTYQLSQYLRRYSNESIRFAMGVSNVIPLFHEAHYQELGGGILEGISRLLPAGVQIYAFGMPVEEVKIQLDASCSAEECWDLPSSGLATLSNIAPKSSLMHLYCYLREVDTLTSLELTEPSGSSSRLQGVLE